MYSVSVTLSTSDIFVVEFCFCFWVFHPNYSISVMENFVVEIIDNARVLSLASLFLNTKPYVQNFCRQFNHLGESWYFLSLHPADTAVKNRLIYSSRLQAYRCIWFLYKPADICTGILCRRQGSSHHYCMDLDSKGCLKIEDNSACFSALSSHKQR